jgi:hypothetical protein
VCGSQHPVDPADEFLYHKTTNRAVCERRRPDCDDADPVECGGGVAKPHRNWSLRLTAGG